MAKLDRICTFRFDSEIIALLDAHERRLARAWRRPRVGRSFALRRVLSQALTAADAGRTSSAALLRQLVPRSSARGEGTTRRCRRLRAERAQRFRVRLRRPGRRQAVGGGPVSRLSRQYSFRFTEALIRRIDAYADDLARGCPNVCITRSLAVRSLVVDALHAFETRAEDEVPDLDQDGRREGKAARALGKEAEDDASPDSDYPVEVSLWIAHPIAVAVDRWREAAFPEERGRVSRAMAVLLLVTQALEQRERQPRAPLPSRRFDELRRAWLTRRAHDPRYARRDGFFAWR